MYEVEIKLPVQSAEKIEAGLCRLGFTLLHRLREEDHYFDNDEGRIRISGEALRVRSITDLESKKTESAITFKGKIMDTVAKTRLELETGVGDQVIVTQIFEALGYHPVSPSVIKVRHEYAMERMHACVDRVEGLGDFLELEIVVSDEREKEAAIREISGVLEKLGYSLEDTIRNSYLGLLQGAEYV